MLRENYVVEDYDKFNYAQVYHHQRYDTHPFLYYFAVHTVCSLFPNTYSNMYALSINIIFMLASDFLIILLSKKMLGRRIYAILPLAYLFFTPAMQKLIILARMYMMLAFFCLLFLWIQICFMEKERWKKTELGTMTCCVVLGTLTHYYFYVYAGCVALCVGIHLLYIKNYKKLFEWILSGIAGILISLILFPWAIWHIIYNQQQKHTNIEMWNMADCQEYMDFINKYLFNERIILYILLCIVILLYLLKKKGSKELLIAGESKIKWILVLVPCVLFSLIIYTLDGRIMYYFTPMYIPLSFGLAAILFWLIRKICKKEILSICITMLLGLWVVNPLSAINDLQENVSEYHKFEERYRIAIENKNCDCIYIESVKDNLLRGLWFELGEYHQFKKISIEDYLTYGLTEACLEGRELSQNSVIVYLPSEYEWENSEASLLIEYGGFKVYKWEI